VITKKIEKISRHILGNEALYIFEVFFFIFGAFSFGILAIWSSSVAEQAIMTRQLCLVYVLGQFLRILKVL
jgi:hypothetical protein